MDACGKDVVVVVVINRWCVFAGMVRVPVRDVIDRS